MITVRSGESVKAPHRRGGAVLLGILTCGVVGVVVGANMWKSDLRVSDVRVQGTSILTEREVLLLAGIRKAEKLYSVDLGAAQRRVLQNAFVKSVAVNREAPSCIAISVEERVPVAAIAAGAMKYLDAEGVVLPQARSEVLFDLPVLTGTFDEREFVPGKQIRNADIKEAVALLSLARELSDDLSRRISEAHVEPGKDIVLYTAESGIPVVFGRGEPGAKLVKFDGFWRGVVAHHGAHELQYVDLRFQDQVVVCWKHDGQELRTNEDNTGPGESGQAEKTRRALPQPTIKG